MKEIEHTSRVNMRIKIINTYQSSGGNTSVFPDIQESNYLSIWIQNQPRQCSETPPQEKEDEEEEEKGEKKKEEEMKTTTKKKKKKNKALSDCYTNVMLVSIIWT